MKYFVFTYPIPAFVKAKNIVQASQIYTEDVAPLDWIEFSHGRITYLELNGNETIPNNVDKINQIEAMRMMRKTYPDLSIRQRYEILKNSTPEVLWQAGIVEKLISTPPMVMFQVAKG